METQLRVAAVRPRKQPDIVELEVAAREIGRGKRHLRFAALGVHESVGLCHAPQHIIVGQQEIEQLRVSHPHPEAEDIVALRTVHRALVQDVQDARRYRRKVILSFQVHVARIAGHVYHFRAVGGSLIVGSYRTDNRGGIGGIDARVMRPYGEGMGRGELAVGCDIYRAR